MSAFFVNSNPTQPPTKDPTRQPWTSPIKLPNDHSPIENPNINPMVIPMRNRSVRIFFIIFEKVQKGLLGRGKPCLLVVRCSPLALKSGAFPVEVNPQTAETICRPARSAVTMGIVALGATLKLSVQLSPPFFTPRTSATILVSPFRT